MRNQLNRATPDETIDRGELHAAIYEIDLTAVTRDTAPLVVFHTFGRVGAAYRLFPAHAHYVNLYVGAGLTEEIRSLLFPDILGAADSVSTQETPPRQLERRHGVIAMSASQAQTFLATLPMSIEIFEIGPNDRPVEMYGISVAMRDWSEFEDLVASTTPVLWLTPASTARSVAPTR